MWLRLGAENGIARSGSSCAKAAVLRLQSISHTQMSNLYWGYLVRSSIAWRVGGEVPRLRYPSEVVVFSEYEVTARFLECGEASATKGVRTFSR